MATTISVIMPTYQRANLIRRSIESVFGQRGLNGEVIELIVIDDGGDDETADVLASIQPPSPHQLIYMKIDHVGRPGLVRNAGLQRASGELVGYCDSDDIWLPNHLATCLRAFALHPGLVMVETWWSFQHLRPGLRRWFIEYRAASSDGRTSNTNSRVHRRDILERVGGFPEDEWGEDIDLWTRIGFAGPIRRLKVPTTANAYVLGGNNVTYRHAPHLALQYGGHHPAPAQEIQTPPPQPVQTEPERVAVIVAIEPAIGAAEGTRNPSADTAMVSHQTVTWADRFELVRRDPVRAAWRGAKRVIPRPLRRAARAFLTPDRPGEK